MIAKGNSCRKPTNAPCSLINFILLLHIRASGEANSEAKDECINRIFASSFVASFASPFVALALEEVFEHESKGPNGGNGSFVLTCTNM